MTPLQRLLSRFLPAPLVTLALIGIYAGMILLIMLTISRDPSFVQPYIDVE
ncbi:MAG: hypothetical protein AAF371_10015 [Pseudomonadota bacterium]